MAILTNTSSIIGLLKKNADLIWGMAPEYESQYAKTGFQVRPSTMAFETQIEMQYMGMPTITAQGADILPSVMQQRFTSTYTHIKLTISNYITKEALQDNQYEGQFPLMVKSARKSINAGVEVLCANIINNAFNQNPAFQGADGQPLASTQHPIYGGVYANTFPAGTPSLDLSLGTLEDAIIISETFPDQAGILCNDKAVGLYIHRDNRFIASRLLNSPDDPSTANRAINAINHDKYLKNGYQVNQYFTNPRIWFVGTNADAGLTLFKRTELEHNIFPNPTNETIGFIASQRVVAGWSNPRCGVFVR